MNQKIKKRNKTMKQFTPLENEEILIEESMHWKNFIVPSLCIMALMALFYIRITYDTANLFDLMARHYGIHSGYVVNIHTQHNLSCVEATIMVFAIMVFIVKMIRVLYTRYYVTNLRIIAISGIVHRRFQEMLMYKCEMVYLNQSLWERIFNSGDILCIAAGADIYLDDVKKAVIFKQKIIEQMAERKSNHGE